MPKFETRSSELFSINMKKIRQNKKISQEDLAEKAGVHRTYIGYLERGERIPSLDYAHKVAEALDEELVVFLREDI